MKTRQNFFLRVCAAGLIVLLFSFFFISKLVAQEHRSRYSQNISGKDVTKSVNVSAISSIQPQYHYSSMNKVNPFVPPLISTLFKKEELPLETTLQRFQLSTLKVVGIWRLRNSQRKAMVLTPDNQGVVVTLDSLIGRRGGKVIDIEDKAITVREFSLASDGSRQYEDSKLWIENGQPRIEDRIVIRSNKIGAPNRMGYGKENYLNSPEYEKNHQELLRKLDEERFNDVPSDDNRPIFEQKKEEIIIKGTEQKPEFKQQIKGSTQPNASPADPATKQVQSSSPNTTTHDAPSANPPAQDVGPTPKTSTTSTPTGTSM